MPKTKCKVEELGFEAQVTDLFSKGLKAGNIAKLLKHPAITIHDIENFKHKMNREAALLGSTVKPIGKKLIDFKFDMINNLKKTDDDLRDLMEQLKKGEIKIVRDIYGEKKEVTVVDYNLILKTLDQTRKWSYFYNEIIGNISRPGQTNININQIETLYNSFKDLVFNVLADYPDALRAVSEATTKLMIEKKDNEKVVDIEVQSLD